jgi:hypothetical protein
MSLRQHDWRALIYAGKALAAYGVHEPGTYHKTGANLPFVMGGGGILISPRLTSACFTKITWMFSFV